MPVVCTGPLRVFYQPSQYFACVFCPTTADAVIYAPKAPSDEGAGFCEAKDRGRDNYPSVTLFA